jgi:hypothetical protein
VFSSLLPDNYSFVGILCSGNMISDPLLSNGRLLRLHRSGFHPACHIIVLFRIFTVLTMAARKPKHFRSVCVSINIDYREKEKLTKFGDFNNISIAGYVY